MTLILRKCYQNECSNYGFYYGNIGSIVTAPNWNKKPEYGNGLHGLKEGNGDWHLLEGDDWLIIEAKDKDIVDIDEDECKFRTGKILFRGNTEELSNSEFRFKLKLNSNGAYKWAHYIGNKDLMIKKIKSQERAYSWAISIGNRDVMIKKIKSEEWAYKWAMNIGNKKEMINKIKSEKWAYKWAMNIGNKKEMIKKIKSEKLKKTIKTLC